MTDGFFHPSPAQETMDALACIFRTLRAWTFYPAGHPSRKNSIVRAHASMRNLLDGRSLSLVSGRTGFSLPNGESLVDGTRLSSTLSFELFIRRVQRITFLSDLFPEDLLELVRILALPPDAVQQAGGMGKIMADRGVRTVWVNELDLAEIYGKRRDVEASGIVPPGVDELDQSAVPPLPESRATALPADAIGPGERLGSLLIDLARAGDRHEYLTLLRQATACAEQLVALLVQVGAEAVPALVCDPQPCRRSGAPGAL